MGDLTLWPYTAFRHLQSLRGRASAFKGVQVHICTCMQKNKWHLLTAFDQAAAKIGYVWRLQPVVTDWMTCPEAAKSVWLLPALHFMVILDSCSNGCLKISSACWRDAGAGPFAHCKGVALWPVGVCRVRALSLAAKTASQQN